jgi:hypothetical protein
LSGRIARLSLAALRMAAGGLPAEPARVAQWLYRFGTVPRGPAIERDFGPDDDPMIVLGMTVGGAPRRQLETAYEATTYQGWYSFAKPGRPRIAAVCKLYLSPRPDALADAFPRIADAFVRCEVRSFKVGRGIEGLLRPDKIVAYFEDHAHMEDVAVALGRALAGCPAQGVPFTAEAGGDGLLSSGVDPPAGEATSWRAWITKRLAASLTAPRVSDPVAAALADLRAAGVDPDRWLPGSAFASAS